MKNANRKSLIITCAHCGKKGMAKRSSTKYPHKECQLAAHSARNKKYEKEYHLRHGCSRSNIDMDRVEENHILLGGQHPRRRVCLQCNRKFKSEGVWNRICGHCKYLEGKGIQPCRRYKVCLLS